jgi:diguanylate cyclase
MTLLRSVSFRLLLLSLGIIAILAFTIVQLRGVVAHDAQWQAHEHEQRELAMAFRDLRQALTGLRLLQGKIGTAMMLDDAVWQAEARTAFDSARLEMESQLSRIEPRAPEPIAGLRAGLDRLPADLALTVEAIRAGRQAEAEARTRALHELVQGLEGELQEAERHAADASRAYRDQEREAALHSLQWVWFSTLAMVLLSGLLALTVIRSLVRPLRQVVTAVRQVSAGENDVSLPVPQSDEFGDINRALHQFHGQAQRLRQIAYQDPVTGLHNRAQLEETLSAGIVSATRDGSSLALLFLDLDNFKSVNDSLGHSAGDRFLREAARRLQYLLPDDAVLCRYSGDKFTVVVRNIRRDGSIQAPLRQLAERLLRGMAEPYRADGDFLYLTVSIGIAFFPMNGQTVEQIVSSADAAMYLAKRSGRNTVQFASPELTEEARRKLTMAGEIRRGLSAGEFSPYYQPIVDVRTGAVVGAEALLRWQHPQRGIVLPDEFIRLAEESGLIGDLGDRCLSHAYEQATRWCRSERPVPISVNLSARQLQDRRLLNMVEDLQSANRLHPQCLEFEITETAMMERPDQSQQALQEISGKGHRLGIDDFGTGYSALGYLQRFPIDRIKIDRSFVARVESSQPARAIITATVALANSLGMEVVAEGVESHEQMRHLTALGCHLQQGYVFARPLPPDAFEAWLAAQA